MKFSRRFLLVVMGGGGSTNSLLHFHNESICQILWLWRSRLSKLVFDWQIALKLGNLTAFKRVFLAVSMKLVRHAKKLFKKRWRVGEGSFGIRMKKHCRCSGSKPMQRNRPCGGGGGRRGDAVGVALCKVSQGDDSTPLECLLEWRLNPHWTNIRFFCGRKIGNK